MPSATTSKGNMNGTKRKAESVKSTQKKESKKAKIDVKESKKSTKAKAPVSSEESSESEFDGLDDEGGVGLDSDTEMVDGDGTPIPKASDGLHPERAKAAANAGQTSRESHAKAKQLAAERKAAKPLAEQLARTKKIWERLRRKSHVPKDERKQLVEELFEIITGRIKDFVLKHDSVRVVQTAIKYANLEQKKMIAKELAGTYRQLAESKYAKFLIGKLLVAGDEEIRDIIVPEFFGHVRRLIKHPEASWILDDVYRGIATKQQKAIILREWYGAEFSLFQKDSETVTGELTEILAENPEKRAPIMRSLQELINHLVQKKMTGFTLLHDAMLQYFLAAKQGTEEITDYIELLKGDEEGDLLKNLAFTRPGSRVVCMALAYGVAKDRKHILKTYKDTFQLMAGDSNAHIVILAAYETVDDTVLTAKSIFPELLSKDAEKQIENVVFSANDLNARTTLLYLYQGRSKALFPASHTTDLEILAEIDTLRATTSKKDPEIRRAELAKALSPLLLTAIASAPGELVGTSFGCQFVTEVLFGADGDKTAALEAIASVSGGDPNAESEEENAMPHIAATPAGGKMLKTLVAGGRFDAKLKKVVPVEPALNFADILYPVIKEHIVAWATGSSSFVVLGLLECEKFGAKAELLKTLKKEKKALQNAATQETAEQKAKREAALDSMEDEKKKVKKNKAGVKTASVGNMGSKLLLEKL